MASQYKNGNLNFEIVSKDDLQEEKNICLVFNHHWQWWTCLWKWLQSSKIASCEETKWNGFIFMELSTIACSFYCSRQQCRSFVKNLNLEVLSLYSLSILFPPRLCMDLTKSFTAVKIIEKTSTTIDEEWNDFNHGQNAIKIESFKAFVLMVFTSIVD